MFTLIDGGFNLFIEEVVNLDLSWLTMFISMVIMNVLLLIRKFVKLCNRESQAMDNIRRDKEDSKKRK